VAPLIYSKQKYNDKALMTYAIISPINGEKTEKWQKLFRYFEEYDSSAFESES